MRRVLVSTITFITALLCAGATNQPLPPPNIVIIMPDDMGWGDPSFNGGEVPTPSLDQLSSESLSLSQFYTFPSCSPSRAALLSGAFPHRLGVSDPVRMIDPGLPADVPLLPEILRSAGYRTAMIGKWHLGGEFVPEQRPHHRGFDLFYGSYQTGIDYFSHENSSGELDWWLNDTPQREQGYITHLQADAAEQFIQNTEDERPFFLFFAPHAPHAPFQAPDKTVDKFSHLRGRSRAPYAAMIAEFDDAVGRILAAIDASGEKANTIVVFFSDNGGTRVSNLGQYRGQKNTLYEGGIRSPFLLRWPNHIVPQNRSDYVASIMDVAPSLLAAASIDPRTLTSADGIDLLPHILSGSAPLRDRVVIGNQDFTAITTRWKLILTSTGSELYDLKNDSAESANVAAEHPEITSELIQFIESFTKDLPETKARPNRRRAR